MIFHLLVVSIALFAIVARAQEGVIFYETFDDEEDVFVSKWVKSNDPKYANQPLKVKAPTKTIPGYETDKGVQLTQEMRHYGFGAKFAQPLVANGSDIVLQYELKMEEKLACGGAYIKMLREDAALDMSGLTNESPYVIMFGPDKCGTESKVHFILKHQNPVTKEWSEHHFAGELKPKLDRSTHLYTLVIRSDNKFEMHIDTKPVAHGSLLENLDPPINPPEMINDPTDFKPADWVDDEFIPDVTATKPADWDETQPRKIPNGSQVKPADWDENMPEKIPDPKVTKPEIWDDEEDGYWEAPQIDNPACEKLSGCGPWAPPMMDNPLYKGRWTPPKVPNPAYKGVWAPRQIKNEAYFQDLNPYASIAPMSALAVEVWTTTAGILFDNFIVATDYVMAFDFAQSTTAKKAKAEREAIKKEEKEAEHQARLLTIQDGTFVEKIQAYGEMVADYLKEHPMIIVDTAIVVVIAMLYFLLFGWKKALKDKPAKAKTAPAAVSESKEEQESTAGIESKSKDD